MGSAPSGRMVPQLAHTARVVVLSGTKTSLKSPAAKFPSSLTAPPTRSSADSCSDDRLLSSFIAASLCWATVTRHALRRSARGSEAFCLNQCWIVAELDERSRGRFYQRGRATDEDVRSFARRPGDLRQHHAIDPALKSGPAPRRLARERERDLQCRVIVSQPGERIAVDHFVPLPRRVQEPRRDVAAGVGGREPGGAGGRHRPQPHDARAAPYEEERGA